ncbi:bifunctional diaminohydroxyphosphoribosylaminopyrimidine deaminase/5-amino-6-(5-phosphoribosylamino)uracil reductase RibD [Blastococcus sp. Marseille-P5729]|uniref:bifunctional diaminohydroxyphosphoribosylaminopyrimidine deaminase/5-amino-6-(5-phosphoribosylamino)uracil reductase RibD n=1 Tax=Blastococcus sp. Marseille-P5729 TaxID=2086582 RepID=UPI001F0320DF|nr:bifunctional diaminohydroxyphosphoribosylaminopyrimidine deaminase/5-amino-6-(5-phosphoribosylamino)uracil reductase RibD [Blastococcus sp. Marseille-P5729]
MSRHEEAMREAAALAELAAGLSSPNPPVGAVVVRDGQIVGRGHTQPAGQAHAEVMALRDAGDLARGSTVVCTLEPCAHTGRTGPCADALISAGVAEVAYAVADPTDEASGGHHRLVQAGVRVDGGVLREEVATGVLRAWLHSRSTGRPYVIWKVGQSLDGQVAAEDGSSQWITGPDSRAAVHRLREQVDAIVVGAGTVRADDPRLTARDAGGRQRERQPLRVVLSSTGRLPAESHVLDGSLPTLVALGPGTDLGSVERITAKGAQAWISPGHPHEGIDLDVLLQQLHERGLLSVLVEGGPTVAGSFAAAGLIDEVQAYLAPKLLVSGMWPALRGYGVRSIGDAIDLEISGVRRIGTDVLVTAVRRAGGK